nr:unnamed protein product [Spirometra erinaceieuropaei]
MLLDALPRISPEIMDVLGNANFIVPLISFMDFECIIFQPGETLNERQLQVYARFVELARREFAESSSGRDITLDHAHELARNREFWPIEGPRRVGLSLALAAGNPSYFAKLMEIIGVQLQIRALLGLLQNPAALTTEFQSLSNTHYDELFFESTGSVPCDLAEAEQFLQGKLEQARILDVALPRLASRLGNETDGELADVERHSANGDSGLFADTSVINEPSPKSSDFIRGSGDEMPKTVVATSQTESAGAKAGLPPLRLPLELQRTPQPSSTSSAVSPEPSEDPSIHSIRQKPDHDEVAPPRLLRDDAMSKRQNLLRIQRDRLVHMRMNSIQEALVAATPADNSCRSQQKQQLKGIRFEVG